MTKCLGSLVIALLSVLVVASPAATGKPPKPGNPGTTTAPTTPPGPGTPAQINSLTIQGDAVVGAALQAIVDVTGDPVPTVGYQWARCDATKGPWKKGGGCTTIDGATSATYTAVDADAGSRLIVGVTVQNSAGPPAYLESAPTAVVPSPPQPTNPPQPNNPPRHSSGEDDGAPETSATAPSPAPPYPVAPAPAGPNAPRTPALVSPYLSPFPVVRIKGASVSGGAIIQLLRVTAPRRAAVNVTCLGRGCPLRHLSARPGHIRPLERFLPAGVSITIRVARRGYIGKYVRFVIRSRAAPSRHDACLFPGSTRPKRCPA